MDEIRIVGLDGEEIIVSPVAECAPMEEKNYFLNPKYCRELREVINSSPIFSHDSKYLSKYNLCCAVMDRLDTCVDKLNEMAEYPSTEEDLLVFMMFACMVTDAVQEILIELNEINKKDLRNSFGDNYKYFKDVYMKSPIYNKDVECPTDDSFFEYIRSLMFAHPFETSRAKFLKNGEKQYSPWVIVNSVISGFYEEKDLIGVRIYTNQSEDIIDLRFPFSTLKNYIGSRYERIKLSTDWARKEIDNTEEEWKRVKVNREGTPVDVLKSIYDILSTRYADNSTIQEAIESLDCEITREENLEIVDKFRHKIVEKLPVICDSVDSLDNETLENTCWEILDVRPPKMHSMANYQLEKIFCYLNEDDEPATYGSNADWGLKQAEYFSEEFAKKWVVIKPYEMSFREIKLLVRVACFFENQEQDTEKKPSKKAGKRKSKNKK